MMNASNKENKNLESQVTLNIENFESFYGLSSLDSLNQLIEIIIDQKKSNNFFKEKLDQISSIFENTNKLKNLEREKVEIFSNKYTFQNLVQKFPKPRAGANKLLLAVLQKKMTNQVISSHHTRKNIWLLASGAKFAMNMNKDLYQSLISYQDYPDYFYRAIKQDINRTVSKDNSFNTEEDLASLENVLVAFSRRNPFVGYCQGLNFVSYFLLTMQFTEEQAFWLLSQIIQTIIPMDYYTNMIGVVTDQQIFIAILKRKCPSIVKKFDQVGLDPSVLTIQWFVCLFASSLPFYLVKIVWDRMFVEGTRAFIKAGIIILKYFQKQILKVHEFHQIILIVEKGSKKLLIPQAEFNRQFQKIFISKEGLAIARNLYRQYHIKEKLEQKVLQKKKRKQVIQCNKNYPICLQSLEKNKEERQEIDVWTFRQQKPPFLIHNYLDSISKKSKQHSKTAQLKMNIMRSQNSTMSQYNFENSLPNNQIIQAPIPSDNDKKKSDLFIKKSQSQNVWLHSKSNYTSNKFQELHMGRIPHICLQDQKKHKIYKNHRQSKNLSMIIEDQDGSEVKKRQTLCKIMEFGVSVAEQEPQFCQPSDNQIRRSRTIKFFNKFLQNNKELSEIIGAKQNPKKK